METETEPVEGEFVAAVLLREGELYEKRVVRLPSNVHTETFDVSSLPAPPGTRHVAEESDTQAVASQVLPP